MKKSKVISSSELKNVIELLNHGIRSDGRAKSDFRHISYEYGIFPNVSPSIRVNLGNTEIILTIKVNVIKSMDSTSNDRYIKYCIRYLSNSSLFNSYEDDNELEKKLNDILNKMWSFESFNKICGIDLKNLRFESTNTSLALNIQGIIMNNDGNLLGAISIATLLALDKLTIPNVDVINLPESNIQTVKIDEDDSKILKIDYKEVPIIMTLANINGKLVLDPTLIEERCADSITYIYINSKGDLYGVIQDSENSIKINDLSIAFEISQSQGYVIINSILEHLNDNKIQNI